VHAIDSFFDGLSLTRFWHRRPLVASTHGGFFHTTFASRLKVAYFNSITRASALGYDRIIASSENDAATFRRIAASKVITIENGVNVEKWKDGGSKVPVRTMIYIGRFSSNKNIQGLIELVGALRKLNPDWRLMIAGGSADVSPNEISHYAREAGVSDVVRVTPSPSDDEIKALVSQASYIASASLYEGFGLSIVEGLSAGLTPIVSDIPPFRKLVSTSGAGIIFNPRNIANEAADIEAAHCNSLDEYTHQRTKNIRSASVYDWRTTAKRFADTYAIVVDQHRRVDSIRVD
jgi:alpha-1,3-mannosyltransferase